MRYILAFILLIMSQLVMAQQGLVVEISIEENVQNSQDVTMSMSKIVMGLNETASVDVEGDYGVTIVSKQLQGKRVNLLVSLHDQSNGAPKLIGDKVLKLTVGRSADYKLRANDHLYKINIDTRYGELDDDDAQRD
ncbi:hypothetical protein [Shewanella inventionis]|uniref:Uncharacterized protein n=1 Tax=Shewanella inventionis TaxID=1738770 RepID=A0ABQ1JF79_9GAMM|nr:hypothetical protein [Shewanella inventionis]MCL1158243.1 hypothetical protein [Shewanella inventionis]GGB64582.1 hypothetical protein GCM10011607_26700 [Shewanella inventionis]